MDLCFPLSIAGQAQAGVSFDEDFAASSGKVEVVSPTAVRFAFASGKSGYLVETGNSASFTKGPVKTRIALPRGKAFRIEWPVTASGGEPGATLYLNQYDRAGRRVAFSTVPFEGEQIAGLIGLRDDAASYSFAIRLTGSGTLDFGTCAIERLPDDASFADVIAGDGKIAEYLRARIAQAIAERRYDLANRLCDLFPTASLHRQIYELQILVARCDYETAARFYEKAGSKLKAQSSARGRYLRALTALERKDDINAVLKAAIAGQEEPSVLAGLFPYMQFLEAEPRAAAAEKLLASGKLDTKLRIGAAQMLLDAGKTERAASVAASLAPETPQLRSEAALLRCNIAIQNNDSAAIRYLSQAVEAFGMEPVTVLDAGAPLTVHNLTARARPLSAPLPKTTIIMSCFNAAAGVGTALRSLRAQSHKDIEIIVVDDCSTDNSIEVVTAAAEGDPRVRLIRQAVNGGTYVARNTALLQATGEFVLTHDSDDWAPPQKIERLVRHLLAHPEQIGVRGQMIRFAEGVGAHYRNGYSRLDFSSFTFRREAALAKAGFFNNVRVGADSEYAYRLQRIFGETSVGELDELINLMAYLPRSLTSGGLFHIDINTGVFSKLRAEYQKGYFHWQENADSLFVPFPHQGALPFPIPAEIKP